MRTEALVGLIGLGVLLAPFVAWLVLRRRGGLESLSCRVWLALYGLGALSCCVVMLRKRLEAAIVLRWPEQYWAANLAQVDNEFWEQCGKLAAMLVVLWLAVSPLRLLFAQKRSAVALGYWTGLGYGIGEALLLAAIYNSPQLSQILTGHGGFFPYLLGWPYVVERLWAMHAHAIMGALLGLGLYGLIGLGSRWRLVLFFVLAMLYHHSVDGLIITARFVPSLAELITQIGTLGLAAMCLIPGLALLWLAYRRA